MKKFLFLLFLAIFSCNTEVDLNRDKEQPLMSRSHNWTDSELATIDSFAYFFLNQDTSSLLNMISELESNANNDYYSNFTEVLNDIGLSQSLYDKLVLLPLEDGISDMENEEVTEEFIVAYKSFIDRGLSLSFKTNERDIVELRKDPCSFASTAWTVLWSAVEMAAGCSTGIGCAVAAVSVGGRFYNYVKDCG